MLLGWSGMQLLQLFLTIELRCQINRCWGAHVQNVVLLRRLVQQLWSSPIWDRNLRVHSRLLAILVFDKRIGSLFGLLSQLLNNAEEVVRKAIVHVACTKPKFDRL